MEGLNEKSAVLVERTLADRITWYASFIVEEQRKKPRVTVSAMASHLIKDHEDVSVYA